jgi:hypothetical protein
LVAIGRLAASEDAAAEFTKWQLTRNAAAEATI